MSDRIFLPVMAASLIVMTSLSGLMMFVNVPAEADTANGTSFETVNLYFDRDRFDFDIDVGVVDSHDDSDLIRLINASISTQRFAVSDSIIDSLMDILDERMEGKTDKEKASALLDFVYMNVWYKTDERMFGQSEYVQYPSETLYNGKGDCEDMAFLLYVLYQKVGLDAVLVHCDSHVAVGVYLDGYGETVSFWGKDYTIADPTSSLAIGKVALDVLYVDRADNPLALNVILLLIVSVELVIGHFLFRQWRCSRE